jgi:hypothetical protein
MVLYLDGTVRVPKWGREWGWVREVKNKGGRGGLAAGRPM